MRQLDYSFGYNKTTNIYSSTLHFNDYWIQSVLTKHGQSVYLIEKGKSAKKIPSQEWQIELYFDHIDKIREKRDHAIEMAKNFKDNLKQAKENYESFIKEFGKDERFTK